MKNLEKVLPTIKVEYRTHNSGMIYSLLFVTRQQAKKEIELLLINCEWIVATDTITREIFYKKVN